MTGVVTYRTATSRRQPRVASQPSTNLPSSGRRLRLQRMRGVPVKGRLADVAKDVTDGQPLPADRRRLARARPGQARDRQLSH